MTSSADDADDNAPPYDPQGDDNAPPYDPARNAIMNHTNRVMKYAAELVQAERQADILGTMRTLRAAERDQSTTAVTAMLARMYVILLEIAYDDDQNVVDGFVEWLLREAQGENSDQRSPRDI